MAQYIVSQDLNSDATEVNDELHRQANLLHWSQWIIFAGNHIEKLPTNMLVSWFTNIIDANKSFNELIRNTSAALSMDVRAVKGVVIEVADTQSWSDETN